MATRQSSWTPTQAQTVYKLKDQLTCSVCMEQYTSPRILPCFHTFCLHCLRGVGLLLQQNNSQYLPCPTCRSRCQLPREGVDGLSPCYFINNLTEACNVLKKVPGKGCTSCEKCHKEDVDYFCRQCVVFLCQECLQLHNEWLNHEMLDLNTTEFSVTATLFDHTPIVGQMSTVNVSLSLNDGSPAPIPLSRFGRQLTPPTNKLSPVSCTVKATSQIGQYTVLFTPVTEGTHLLHVKLDNSTNPGNSISVTLPVVKLRGSVVKTITGFEEPDRIAVSDDGRLFISEWEEVTIVTRDGEKVKSFRSNMCNPSGIAITPEGSLLVVDWGSHCLLKFTLDGEYISSIGSNGDGPLEFESPHGIAINKTTGQVYIADSENHRVQVLNADLTFSHSIESLDLVLPRDVAIDGEGFIYVAGCDSVLKLNPDGSKVLSFADSLFGCRGITVNDSGNVLYISHSVLGGNEEEKPQIAVCCTNTGEVIHQFGADSFSYPAGCTFEQTTGYLYVSSGCCHIDIYS